MEQEKEDNKEFLKSEFENVKPICRCCLSTDRLMFKVSNFSTYFEDLAGLTVSESDGLPQYLCWECRSLLEKAVKFKRKVLRAHTVLYEYLTRCAPFPIDGQDAELVKYSSCYLSVSEVLTFSTYDKSKFVSEIYQHKKQNLRSELDSVQVPVELNELKDDLVKEEAGFSDYEDNMTLEVFRSEANNLIDEDLTKLLEDSESVEMNVSPKLKKRKNIKKEKVKKKKIKQTENLDRSLEPKVKSKSSIRKHVELDPNKIRVITLNPDEQIKQRKEESKGELKYPYWCNLCYKGFNFDSKLQNHMYKHNPARGPYKCKFCHIYLPTAYSYNVHSFIHTKRYECTMCSRRMIDRTSILDHYRTQHEGLLTMFNCNLCGKVSVNNKTHRGHMRNHHSGDRPKCDQCGKTFVNKDSLAEHQQIHQGIKNYECSICSKKFRTRTQIVHHQLKHSDVKEYYCVECDIRFKSAQSLRQHLLKSLKHKDEKTLKYPCSRCDKRYETERDLRQHTAIQHEGVRPHVCTQCGAALASRTSLTKHTISIHQGTRPPLKHVCDTCGKAFRAKSALQNHIRTHTGEKPFPCTECGRKFSQRSAMLTHVKLVHLKVKRNTKIKPEEPKVDIYKTESVVTEEPWPRHNDQQPQARQPCGVYFRVTAGP